MARSKIGPAFALWATAMLAAVVWSVVINLVLLGWAFNSLTDQVARSSVTQVAPLEDPVAEEPAPSGADEPLPAPVEPSDDAASEDDAAPHDEPEPLEDPESCGNLVVESATTTCAFAQNVFWEYWTATGGSPARDTTIRAYSEAVGDRVTLECAGEDPVACRSDGGADVRMPLDALAAYSQEDADAYALDHMVGGG